MEWGNVEVTNFARGSESLSLPPDSFLQSLLLLLELCGLTQDHTPIINQISQALALT